MLDFKAIGSGIKDAFKGVGDGVTDIIDSAKGQLPPETVGKLKELETTLKTKGMEIEYETKKMFYDSMLQYEGSAAQVPKWILVLRSVIRPVITIIDFLSFMFFIGSDIVNRGVEGYVPWMQSLPSEYWWITLLILGFWFGGKIGENIVDKINNNSNP